MGGAFSSLNLGPLKGGPLLCASLRGRKVSDIGQGLASFLTFLFVHVPRRNFFDRFLFLAGKPIGDTHYNAEKAKAEYNHRDAHNALISYLALGAGVAGSENVPERSMKLLLIATDDQDETDRYWNAIVGNDGQESACGWCKDKWGVSWQITPRVLTEALAAGGNEAKRAFDAMMGMRKIDVAAIKAARRG